MLLDMFQRHLREEFRGRACGGGLVMLLAVRHGFPPGGVPPNAAKDNIFVDTAAFSKVVYPPGQNEEDEPQEEEAAESTWHNQFREIPDNFNLPLVAQLTTLQADIERLDLNYAEEERRFEEYSINYYHQRYDSMEQWNSLYDSGFNRMGGDPGAGPSN